MTKFWPPKSTIWACQFAKRIEVHVAPTPAWRSSEKSKARTPDGWPDLETLVRQHSPRRTCLSGSNDEGHVRCASARRRPAHAMSRTLPINRISCSGADPLQIHRSHCTNTATGNGDASRLFRGIAAPARYPGLQAAAQPVALRLTNFKLWMAPATELVRTRDRSCRAAGNHLLQVVGHVRLCRLTRVNAAFQSPFRPESPMLKVLAECPSCDPGNALANVEIQVPALSQIRDKFGCVPKFREHQTLTIFLRLVAAVLLSCFRISLLF